MVFQEFNLGVGGVGVYNLSYPTKKRVTNHDTRNTGIQNNQSNVPSVKIYTDSELAFFLFFSKFRGERGLTLVHNS